MAKEKDVKTIAERITALGIPVTITKSRFELLKALAPPANVPHPRTT
ncbi:Lmo0850 family protein [Bhargavaea cecembensis]|nr:Lmo0850 family protein [Bhargavaea cecembensis]